MTSRPPPRKGARPAQKPLPPGPRPSRQPDRWLYGHHAVAAAWANPARICRRLLATEGALAGLAEAMAAAAALDRPAPEPVERALLDRLLPGAVHQGVAVEVEPLPAPDLDDLGRMASLRDAATVLVLDQVTDPHNVGAILRSAAAFGALAVLVTDRHAPEVTGVIAKSASGAVEHVPLVRATNLGRALDQLHGWSFGSVGLDEAAPGRLDAVPVPPRLALVLGAEGSGLRAGTRAACQALARLPTGGPIGSLNVSNAAAVALYEAARRRL